jgi:hypothetical protein
MAHSVPLSRAASFGPACVSSLASFAPVTTSNASTSSHEFVSHHSAVDESEFAITVGFSRDPADEVSLDGLLLQRGRGTQKGVPGIQGVYVEIPIQRHVVYGGITEASLRRNSFILRFDEPTAHTMGCLYQILVRFDLPDDEFAVIRDGLRFVFTGCSCYREEHENAG